VANIFENQDRRVIPNWRTFRKTVALGELDENAIKGSVTPSIISIDQYLLDWQANKTIGHAGDLLSAAIANNVAKSPLLTEVAEFIIKQKEFATHPQISIAEQLTDAIEEHSILSKLENMQLDEFPMFVDKNIIWRRIKEIKITLRDYGFNAIQYVELSRNYSILGEEKKATRAMRVALQLAPDNRFVLRCAVRLFAHYNLVEFAHDILRKSPATRFDPWLTSAEIALATIRERSSKFIKHGIEMIGSKNISPFSLSELASSIGTVELIHGSIKSSRSLFKTSLIAPNDNSLAQMEWAATKEKSLAFDLKSVSVNHNFEALALDHYQRKEFKDSLNKTFKWFLDMPFSKRPVMLGAHIAGALLNDRPIAREFCKAGLISHPRDAQIINNLVYSLALDNEINEATRVLDAVDESSIDSSTRICLTATRGLICFRSGLSDMGRKFYLEAIEQSKHLGDPVKRRYFNWLAVLNFAREEILSKSDYVEGVISSVGLIPERTGFEDIEILRSEVLARYGESKK
jgi:hypothetical protein